MIFFYLQSLALQGIMDLYSHEVSGVSDCNAEVDVNNKDGPEFSRQRAAGQDKWGLHIASRYPKGMSKCTGEELIRVYRHGNGSNR